MTEQHEAAWVEEDLDDDLVDPFYLEDTEEEDSLESDVTEQEDMEFYDLYDDEDRSSNTTPLVDISIFEGADIDSDEDGSNYGRVEDVKYDVVIEGPSEGTRSKEEEEVSHRVLKAYRNGGTANGDKKAR